MVRGRVAKGCRFLVGGWRPGGGRLRVLLGAGLTVGALAGAGLALAQTPLPAFVEIPNSPFANFGQEASSVVFSPDGRLLANTAKANVAVFSVGADGTLTGVAPSPFGTDASGATISQSVAFSQSGGFLAMAVYNNAWVVMYRVEPDGTLQQVSKLQLKDQGQLRSVAFRPGGTLLAISHNVGAAPPEPGANEVTTVSVGTDGTLSGEKNYPLPPSTSGPEQVAFNPLGTLLAVANDTDNRVSVFPVAADGTLGARTDTTLPAGSRPFAVTFNPGGTLLAVGNLGSNILSVFPVAADGTLGARTDTSVAPGGNGPSAVAFNPTGTLVVTGNRNSNNLSVFEVGGDVTLTPVPGSPFALRAASSPVSVAFSPIAPLLASGNGTGSQNVSVLSPPAALHIAKVASSRQVAPGGVLGYTVRVRNTSNVFSASGPVVDDVRGVLDQAALVGSPRASTGTVTVDRVAGTLTWDGTLPPGGTARIRYLVRVDASLDSGLLVDRVDGPPGSNCTASPAAGPCLTETPIVRPAPPPPQADLDVSKTASTRTAHPGGQVLYTLTVHNSGPSDATNVILQDPLPPGLFVQSVRTSLGTCTIEADQVVCRLGTIPVGGGRLVLVTTTVATDASGRLTNEAFVFGNESDPDPTNNTAGSEIAVTPLPVPPSPPAPAPDPGPQPVADLMITKHADNPHHRARVGTRLSYTITVTNRGHQSARDVRVVDAFKLRVRALSRHAHPSRGSCRGTRPIRCSLGTLAPDARVTITIHAIATGSGAQINAASVMSGSWDPDTADNIAVAHSHIAPRRRPPPFTG